MADYYYLGSIMLPEEWSKEQWQAFLSTIEFLRPIDEIVAISPFTLKEVTFNHPNQAFAAIDIDGEMVGAVKCCGESMEIMAPKDFDLKLIAPLEKRLGHSFNPH